MYTQENKLHYWQSLEKTIALNIVLEALLRIEKTTLDKGRFVVAIFIYFSKAFDTSNHNFLAVEVGEYRICKDTYT